MALISFDISVFYFYIGGGGHIYSVNFNPILLLFLFFIPSFPIFWCYFSLSFFLLVSNISLLLFYIFVVFRECYFIYLRCIYLHMCICIYVCALGYFYPTWSLSHYLTTDSLITLKYTVQILYGIELNRMMNGCKLDDV